MEITRIGDLSPGVRAHLVHRYEQTGSCVSDSERTLGKERCTSDSTLVLFKSPGRYNFTTADTHTRALFLSHTHSLTRTLTCTRTLTAPSISTRLHFAENLSIQEQIWMQATRLLAVESSFSISSHTSYVIWSFYSHLLLYLMAACCVRERERERERESDAEKKKMIHIKSTLNDEPASNILLQIYGHDDSFSPFKE